MVGSHNDRQVIETVKQDLYSLSKTARTQVEWMLLVQINAPQRATFPTRKPEIMVSTGATVELPPPRIKLLSAICVRYSIEWDSTTKGLRLFRVRTRLDVRTRIVAVLEKKKRSSRTVASKCESMVLKPSTRQEAVHGLSAG